MHTERAPLEETPAGLGELVRCLVRARWTVLGAALAGLGLAALGAALARPLFRAQATILIEQSQSSGLLGDLAILAGVSAAPATASELSILESRGLAEHVLSEGRDDQGGWNPEDPRRLGLETLVEDGALRPLALLQRWILGARTPEVPLVLPGRGLDARVVAATSEAPAKVRVEFVGRERVRLARAGTLQSLHFAARDEVELDFRPRVPLAYQGLELELAPWGEFEGATFVLEHLPHHEALRRLRERTSVRETSLNSGVIEIAVEDSDPRRAARTVNALCGRYLETLATRGQRRASKTAEYVQGLLDRELERFDAAQKQVLSLQKESPELIAPDGAAGALIEEMSTLEVERVQIDLSERALGEIVTALEGGDARALAQIDASLGSGLLVDPITSGLLGEIARLQAQTSTLGTDLAETHPLLLRNQEASRALVEQARAQLDSRRAGLATRARELERVREELRGRLAAMPEGLRKLAEMRVQFSIHSELVPYLIKSLQGAEITRSNAETLAETIDSAVPPDRLAAPDPLRMLILGLLGGLVTGMVLAFWHEPRRGRVHTSAELGTALEAERVVSLARLDARELVFRSARASRAAESIRTLRGALRFGPDGETRQAIGVVGLETPEAGAALAAELALAFVSEGRRTLLIETAAGAAGETHLGVEPGPGLAEHLATGGSWRELVRAGGSAGPDVLGAGRSAEPIGDLLARAGVERLLEESRAQYDTVVLALPGVETLTAAPALTRALDVLCLVHRARSQARARVAGLARELRVAGARALTGVLVEKRA